MAKNNFIYSSFLSGEVSPKFYGRTETQQYNQASEEVTNMLIYPQGGAGRRPGTISKLRLLKSDGVSAVNKCRMIPFQGTDGTRWQLMITDEDPTSALVNVVGRDRAPWRAINTTDGTTQNITTYQNSPVWSTTYPIMLGFASRAGEWDFSSTGKDIELAEIQYAQSGDTMVITHGTFRPIVIIYDPTQASDSKFFFRGYVRSTIQQELIGPTFSFTTRGFEMPCIDPGDNTDDVVFHVPSATVATQDTYLTSSAITFDSSWVGRFIKLQNGANSFFAYVSSFNPTGSKAMLYVIRGNISLATGTYTYGPSTSGSSWTQGEWNDTFGWPKTVSFFDSRLVFGGTALFPDKEWFSETDNIYTMDPIGLQSDAGFSDPAVATDPFAITLKEATYSEIRWMNPKKNLTTGTNSGEFIVQGPDQTQSIGPTNAASNIETPYGSAPVQAIGYENTVMFLGRNRKSLHEMVYDLAENSFIAPDLNIVSEHAANRFALSRTDAGYGYAVVPGAFLGISRQMTPLGVVWAYDNNGCLAAITRDRNQNVAAWHFHEIVGPGVKNGTDTFDYKPQVISLSSIQKRPLDSKGTGGEPDEIWLAVKRAYIDPGLVGQVPARTDVFIEKFAPEWDRGAINKNWDDTTDTAPVYMDGSFIFNSDDNPDVESEGIIYCPHMTFGQVVSVIMDGFDLGEFTVNTNGEIDISAYLDENRKSGDTNWSAVVGFNYNARLSPIVAEAPAQQGSSLGFTRRIHELTINFYRTIGVRFGRATSLYQQNTPISPLEEISFPEPTDLSTPQQLFSGSKKMDFDGGYEGRPHVVVESFRPFPCVITHIIAKQVVYED